MESDLTSALTLYLNIDTDIYKLEFRNGILDFDAVTDVADGALSYNLTDAEFRAYLTDNAVVGTASGGTIDDVNYFFTFIDLVDQLPIS